MAGSSSVPLEYHNKYLYSQLTITSISYLTTVKELPAIKFSYDFAGFLCVCVVELKKIIELIN